MRVKQFGNHDKHCYAVRAYRDGTWSTPWAYLTGDAVNLDSIGRQTRGIGERWVKVICNCTFCHAYLLIAEKDILELAVKD